MKNKNLKELGVEVNKLSHEKGFYDKPVQVPEKLMLIVSELSEALEAHRKDRFASVDGFYNRHDIEGGSFDKAFLENIKDTFEDEMADAAIRLFDLCEELRIDLGLHVELKHKYNSTRPYMHGKKY